LIKNSGSASPWVYLLLSRSITTTVAIMAIDAATSTRGGGAVSPAGVVVIGGALFAGFASG